MSETVFKNQMWENCKLTDPKTGRQVMPCCQCGEPVWFEPTPSIVAAFCDKCGTPERIEDIAMSEAEALYQAQYAYACGYHD